MNKRRVAADHTRGTCSPMPAGVRYNDWRAVDMVPAGAFEPSLPVSVIVPYFEAPDALALTFAALETQTYPRSLVEVVVVDDGSRPSLGPPPSAVFDVKVVRQRRRGFGLARARNSGARAAAHDILVFLDCDVLAEADMLMDHARWHHAVSDALTIGFCHYVSTEGLETDDIRQRPGSLSALFADREFDPSWTDGFMAHTDQLTAKDDSLFRVVTGGNFGIRKAFYRSIGGCDESFMRYGSEDTEFGYRAFAHGALLVPMPTPAWHQGRWQANRTVSNRAVSDKEISLAIMRAKIVNLIPHREFRPSAPGRTYAVPEHVVTVCVGAVDAQRTLRTVETILADPVRDLVVRIETRSAQDAEFAWLKERLGPDPRVSFAAGTTALDEFPASPFHIALPASATFEGDLVRFLRTRIGDAVVATAALDDGNTVSITRGWALHRAHRARKTAADFGTAVTLHLRPSMAQPGGADDGGRLAARLLDELRPVRSIASAWSLLKRLSRGAGRRLLRPLRRPSA